MDTSIALVAMTGMLVAFGLPLLLVAIILYYKHRKARVTRHQSKVRTVLRRLTRGDAALADDLAQETF
ncbi:MAG TPA: hypothetical protein VII36_04915, partial [Usitatibacter sp.]